MLMWARNNNVASPFHGASRRTICQPTLKIIGIASEQDVPARPARGRWRVGIGGARMAR
jgi:hypothetical protein